MTEQGQAKVSDVGRNSVIHKHAERMQQSMTKLANGVIRRKKKRTPKIMYVLITAAFTISDATSPGIYVINLSDSDLNV